MQPTNEEYIPEAVARSHRGITKKFGGIVMLIASTKAEYRLEYLLEDAGQSAEGSDE